MNKAVLISLQPKWCELIFRGKKTIEIRKTKPKLETPFKCYIYQSKSRDRLIEVMKDGDLNFGEIYHGKPVFIKTMGYESGYEGLFGREQKIVGEFICNKISEYEAEFYKGNKFYQYIREIFRDYDNPDDECRDFKILTSNDEDNPDNCELCKKSCLSFYDFKNYIGEGFCKTFYGWQISGLVIYDKPKELRELRSIFRHYGDGLCGDCEYYYYANNESYRYEECAVDGLKPITRPPQSWCYVEECDSE